MHEELVVLSYRTAVRKTSGLQNQVEIIEMNPKRKESLITAKGKLIITGRVWVTASLSKIWDGEEIFDF